MSGTNWRINSCFINGVHWPKLKYCFQFNGGNFIFNFYKILYGFVWDRPMGTARPTPKTHLKVPLAFKKILLFYSIRWAANSNCPIRKSTIKIVHQSGIPSAISLPEFIFFSFLFFHFNIEQNFAWTGEKERITPITLSNIKQMKNFVKNNFKCMENVQWSNNRFVNYLSDTRNVAIFINIPLTCNFLLKTMFEIKKKITFQFSICVIRIRMYAYFASHPYPQQLAIDMSVRGNSKQRATWPVHLG